MPVDTIEDPTIKITPSPKLISFVQTYVTDTEDIPVSIASLKKYNKNDKDEILLSTKDIKWLHDYLADYRKSTEDKIYLHEILEASDIKLPMPKITPRNPELEARIQKLTAEQNAREYAAMTRSVDSVRNRYPNDSIGYQIKQMNKQLIAVAQFIFSVIAGFMFGFIGIELIVGNLDFGFRLLLGIICALIIALAEIYFLALKLNEDFFDVPAPAPKKLHQE